MMRAQIRAPFNGEIISLNTRLLDTIDNVKAKIDSVKAKTQDKEV
jgi:glycine cleavage system H lipoate-binding protein